MAKGASNADLKRRNGRIFRTIEGKLGSNDEETFLSAAGKIKSYIEKREAYYPEARPLIVNICKTARATLTRLANSNAPFSGDQPFPPALKNRVLAYAHLIGTVLHHASTFETDHSLKEDLRELFTSVMLNAPQASDSTAESSSNPKLNGVREETQSHMDAIRSESKIAPYADVDLGPPNGSEAPTCPSRSSTAYTETHQETHSNINGAETLEMGDPLSKSKATPLTGQLASDTDSADPPAHPPSSFVDAGRAINVQIASSVEIPPLHSQAAPTLSHGTLKGADGESAPSERKARTQLARKARKIPKLVGKAQTDIALEDMDWQYHMSKRQQTSDPRVSSGSVVATADEQNANIGVVDPVSVVDGKVKETIKADPSAISLVDTSRGDQPHAGSSSAPNDVDALIDMNLDLPLEDSEERRTLARDSYPTSEGDSMSISSDQVSLAQSDMKHHVDTPTAESQPAEVESAGISTSVADAQASIRAGAMGVDLGCEDGDRRLVAPGDINDTVEHVDAMDNDDSATAETSKIGRLVESSHDQSSGVPHYTQKDMNTHSFQHSVSSNPQTASPSGFIAHSIIFGAVDIGGKTGDTVVMDWELAPDQKDKLAIWQMHDRHEREVSGSICLSLACYKISDALEAGFNFDSKDVQTLSSALHGLTPSWPTNARLSADIGRSRLFLAPPLQMTMEGLVDISLYVSEGCVRIRLVQAGDMTEYIFVLVAHPPTSSQLLELEERKAKNRKFRTTLLEGLRLTAAEVFG